MGRTTVVAVAMSALVVGAGASQQRLAFEVASARVVVDMNVPTDAPFRYSNLVTEDRAHLTASLRSLLIRAFRVKDYELVAPEWTNGWIVEVRGTLPPGAMVEQVPDMLRTLLIERFGLVTHTETRPLNAYQLLVGASGIKMREVETVNDLDTKFDDAVTTSSGVADRTTQTTDGPVRTINTRGAVRRITSQTMYERTTGGSSSDGRTLTATRMTMPELASILTGNVGEQVFDRTGLIGLYQFTIELPEDEPVRRLIRILREHRAGLPPGDVMDDDTAANAARTLKAVEGLGLKLERRRMPIDVVVVDSIRRQPTEN